MSKILSYYTYDSVCFVYCSKSYVQKSLTHRKLKEIRVDEHYGWMSDFRLEVTGNTVLYRMRNEIYEI